MKNLFLTVAAVAGLALNFGAFAADEVNLTIPELPAGKSITILFDAMVNSPVSSGASFITTQATVSGDNFATVLSDNPDTAGADATSIALEASHDLKLTKTDNKTVTSGGQILTYALSYSNAGDQDASGVVINETLPGNTQFNADNSTAGWVDEGGGKFKFAVGTLAGGAAGSVNFAVKAGNGSAVPTVLANTASISDDNANGADPVLADNVATDNTDLPPSLPEGVGNAPNGGGATFTEDSDGDGFTNAVEIEAGTDPNSNTDTPLGGTVVEEVALLEIKKFKAQLDFKKPGKDRIYITGMVTVPEEKYDFNNKRFVLNVGGNIEIFDVGEATRISETGNAWMNVRRPKPNTVVFDVKYDPGNYKDALATSADLTNGNFNNVERWVPVSIVFSSTLFRNDVKTSYRVKNKIGTAR